MKEKVLDELKRAFRPEFINRIDDIIVFHALSREHITAIVQLMIDRINKQLSDKGIQLEPTGAAMDMLVQRGYDPTYGARQLRRTIQKYVEDPLAETCAGSSGRRANRGGHRIGLHLPRIRLPSRARVGGTPSDVKTDARAMTARGAWLAIFLP
jgi:ATP-dependent Clp protease ATP-binding subunit ClpA